MRSTPSRGGCRRSGTSRPPPPPDAVVPTERAHRVLEGLRAWRPRATPSTSPSSTNDVAGQRPRDGDDAGEAVGDVVEVAGVDAHVVAGAVDLDAGAVELPLHRRRAGVAERLGDVGGAGGQHRLDRVSTASRTASSASRALVQRQRGGAAEVAREHRGAPDDGERHVGRLGDGVGHHPGQRALAQLAGEQPADEVRLGLGGAREEVGEQRLARRHRPGAGGAGQRRSGSASSSSTSTDGSVGGLDVDAVGRPPADADAALPGRAR